MTASTRALPLAEQLWPDVRGNRWLRNAVLIIGGSLLLTLAAKIQVPFYPVPMTLETLAVLLIGALFGARLGAVTVLLFLTEGALGLPVFADTPQHGIGLAYMLGPTGGYLVGFLLAAVATGWLAERGWDRRPLSAVAMLLIGNVLIYLPGLAWLGTLLGWDKPILAWGLYPFLLGDALKLALAATTLPLAWRVFGKRSD